MNTEFELRILEIDPKEFKQKIINASGRLVLERTLMRRYTFDTIPADRNKWMRLRDDGKTVKLGVKHVTSHSVDGTKEYEAAVASLEDTLKVLKELGIEHRSYQENFRTAFRLDNCEVTIDEWPKIPPFAEVEGPDEQSVLSVLAKLGYQNSDATGEDISTIFENHYQIMIDDIPELVFEK